MYIITFSFQLVVAVFAAGVASTLILHAFGSCWMFVTFMDDLTMDIITLNEYDGKEGSDVQLYEQLREFIEFHAEIKQLSLNSEATNGYQYIPVLMFIFRLLAILRDIYSLIFTSNLLWTVSVLGVLLLSLQMELVEYFSRVNHSWYSYLRC